MTKFSEINLNKPLLNAINDLGLEEMTPIQEQTFSNIMSGRDILGIAQTGTGKTFAYLLPAIRLWSYTGTGNPQILIIVPTRELVVQIVKETEKLSKYQNIIVKGVYGGVNINTQSVEIYSGMDVLIATPGRLFDLVVKGVIRLKSIKKLIIDEVDEMLNLGFRHQLTQIFDLLPLKRQNLLFSATITTEINALVKVYFTNPLKISITDSGIPLENISQLAYNVPNFNTKLNLLELLLEKINEEKILIFVSTKKNADIVFERINKLYPEITGIVHSNKAQNYRLRTVKQFHEGDYKILIATDLLARGMDFINITKIINFDMPEIPEDYIHRIGRTGRAEKKGKAVSFILQSDKSSVLDIENMMKKKISVKKLPTNLQISEILTADEKPKVNMKNIVVKTKDNNKGKAFEQKQEKNKKVNKRVSRKDKMNAKYGKPITRGQKVKKGK